MATDISGLAHAGQEIGKIPVPINYDIIRLFSEGLYRSPHKAIEELVSNGYDADASRVHVLLPDQPEDETNPLTPLWVIDDGHGMDVDGFHQLWRVAESNKADQQPTNGRAPIGQFGIGKLAAYVLAWKLTHLSRVNDKFLLTIIKGQADIRCADARTLENVDDESFDLALTSPPYLNAIDYLRGHRLALVWLVYAMEPLREIRSASIGAERVMPEAEAPKDISRFIIEQDGSTIQPRHRGWIRRYASDMDAVLRQLGRVVKRNRQVVLVLGNSFLRGATIDNAGLIQALAERIGFQIQDRHSRELPARRRYLPPPGNGQSALDTRMRTETVLTFNVQ